MFGVSCVANFVLMVMALTYACKHHRLLKRSQELLLQHPGYVQMGQLQGAGAIANDMYDVDLNGAAAAGQEAAVA